MTLGDKIKYYRNKSNFTQEELGNKSGLSRNAIYNYEKSKRQPDFIALDRIAEALGCTLMELVGSDNTNTEEQSNYLENYLEDTGYSIEYDEDNGSLFLVSDLGTYEITLEDIDDIKNSTKSFIQFKLSEVMKRSRKLGK